MFSENNFEEIVRYVAHLPYMIHSSSRYSGNWSFFAGTVESLRRHRTAVLHCSFMACMTTNVHIEMSVLQSIYAWSKGFDTATYGNQVFSNPVTLISALAALEPQGAPLVLV